jgi:hypothetical protein
MSRVVRSSAADTTTPPSAGFYFWVTLLAFTSLLTGASWSSMRTSADSSSSASCQGQALVFQVALLFWDISICVSSRASSGGGLKSHGNQQLLASACALFLLALSGSMVLILKSKDQNRNVNQAQQSLSDAQVRGPGSRERRQHHTNRTHAAVADLLARNLMLPSQEGQANNICCRIYFSLSERALNASHAGTNEGPHGQPNRTGHGNSIGLDVCD